jgi:uncharacterized protein (TIGR02271 family)
MASGIVLLAVGCGTTSNRSQMRTDLFPQEGVSAYSEARVEGQRAREAGMNEDRWIVRRKALAAETEVAAPEPRAEGGASTTGQGVAITTGTPELEILDQAEIDLRKEELVVGKREVSNGGVLIRTVVQTDEVSQPVELRREEYVIERIAAGSSRDQQARAENAFQGREIYIPLMREEPVASKRTLLTERVKVGKRIEMDHKTITMPVRSEDVEIVKNPDLSDPRFSTVPRRSTAMEGKSAERASRPQTETSTDTLNLAKEELVVGKRDVDAGGVFLQKVIRTENATQPIELRREEFAIERAPLEGQLESADFSQRQIKLNLTREEAVAGTRNYVAETVRVRKQLQTDKQIVSGSVRKEAVEIVKLSDQPVSGQGGTGISSQSGVTVTTESGVAEPRGEKK